MTKPRTKNIPTGLVRDAINKIAPVSGSVTIQMVAIELKVNGDQRAALISRFIHLLKLGELERVRRGEYRPVSKATQTPCTLERAWSVMRSRRVFTIEDVMEIAEVQYSTVKHMVWKLKRNGYLRRVNAKPEKAKYQLIKNVVERPKFDWKGNEVKHGNK